MVYRLEKLDVWQLARDFTKVIYKITNTFPKDEIYGLTSQTRRASVSIVLNIAEGSERKSDVEFIRFLRIAYSSLQEVIAASYKAYDQEYINEQTLDFLHKKSNIVG